MECCEPRLHAGIACCVNLDSSATEARRARFSFWPRLSGVSSRLIKALATWRLEKNQARHEAQHLAYLDSAALNDMRLSSAMLRDLGVERMVSDRQGRSSFPF